MQPNEDQRSPIRLSDADYERIKEGIKKDLKDEIYVEVGKSSLKFILRAILLAAAASTAIFGIDWHLFK